MKKALHYSASALAMFGFASCSNDLNEPNAVPDGTEVAVSFDLNLPKRPRHPRRRDRHRHKLQPTLLCSV